MNIVRTLADWRIIGGLVAIGASVSLLAPSMVAAAIPLLIVAACPVSMVVMMRSMGTRETHPSPSSDYSGDRRRQLQDQLSAKRLEQLQLEQEVARLETATPAVEDSAPTADVPAGAS